MVRSHLVSVSFEGTTLTFELDDGKRLSIAFRDGEIAVNDEAIARYRPGGALEAGWRQLLADASRLSTAEVVGRVHTWQPVGLGSEDLSAVAELRKQFQPLSAARQAPLLPQAIPPAPPGGLSIRLDDLTDPAALEPALRSAAAQSGPGLRLSVPGGQARLGHFSVGSGERLPGHLLVLRGDADIYGTVTGNLATVDGDVIVHPGAVVTGDVLALGGDVQDAGGEIRGEIRTLRAPAATHAIIDRPVPLSPVATAFRNAAGLVGVFSTLLVLGFALTLFGRQPLEVVSDTVTHSFARSFLVGLMGQVMLLPTFGMLVVGLVLSVAGILLLPFALIVFPLLVIVAVLGGFLGVAHAMGETYTRRRMAMGAAIGSANSYRYVLVGLVALLSLWSAWVLFGWVPVAGTLIFLLAVLVTWLLGTVGFGAALLSRGG
ncbi:MAG: hypothetical protein ACREMO_10355, partial [Gemmatimonadales bacterium]